MRKDDRVALIAFVAVALLGGANAVGIRFSNRELAPLWGAGLRFALAAGVLAIVMAVLRLRLPRGRALTGVLLFGLLDFGAGFALGYYALVELHAGFGAILLALVPLATLLLAVAQRQEHLGLAGVLGTLVALAGIAWLSRSAISGSVPLLPLAAAVGAAVCFGQASVLVRRFPPVHPVTMNAVGLVAGAAVLVIGSFLVGEPRALPQHRATWLTLAYLVAIGSVVVFVLYLVVLKYWAASRAAYAFVLMPLVTVALSAWLDDEPIGPGLVLGGLLVLAGVYVGALRPARSRDAGSVDAERTTAPG
jgi:drug/metabolite transporter (DMT)-like permease